MKLILILIIVILILLRLNMKYNEKFINKNKIRQIVSNFKIEVSEYNCYHC